MSLPKTKQTASAANNYQAIRAKIERDRLLPWGSAVGVKIDEFTVLPLSFRSLVDLELSENAFLNGEVPTAGDIAAYIWRHMPDYKPSFDSSDFIKKIAENKNLTGLIEGIWRHFGGAFADPPVSLEFGGFTSSSALPPVPHIASVCTEYGAAFGMDPQDVADIDLKIVFQCVRVLRIKEGKKFGEPEELKKAKSIFLKAYGKN